ncbi:macro domain-containing protein [Vibrio parahaemolyticus]|nr:macro domain-containing protein [Vibrio parahaemolyticus]ELA6807503.1 macro domain-containing protein [Vibrio parahaemolyticus]
MIEFVSGDFFDFDADIRVNTVNCVGVMGAGVALAFKNKYPDMFKQYVDDCKLGLVKPGAPSVWVNNDLFSKKIEIINFPTKDHWRNDSEYEYVESGLKWLSNYLKQKPISTITLPALGCGHGKLDWIKVKHLIETYLSDSKHRILVFEPHSSKNAGKIQTDTHENDLLLEQVNIKKITSKSSDYPDRLKLYTEKDLYLFSSYDSSFIGYDVSIISSSKPNSSEVRLMETLVDYCVKNRLSVLFGSSAFEKKIAFSATKLGIDVGVFMPTNIYDSARKANLVDDLGHLTLLSIGNPFVSFDKKAYIPSILSRLFIAKKTVFTTNRLEWIQKQSKYVNRSDSKFYYFDESLSEKDELAIKSISGAKIEFLEGKISL